MDKMDKLLGALAYAGEVKVRTDDDAVDRLNRNLSTFLLILFAFLVSTKQYVGEPISCWAPAQFTGNHIEYANKVCWVSNTYYLPFNKRDIPEQWDNREQIGYYQWIPLILICQATLFYVPALLWRFFASRSGLSVKTIMHSTISCQRSNSIESSEKTIRFVAVLMDSYLSAKLPENMGCWHRIKKSLSKKLLLVCGRVYGNYLTILYLLIKLLYLGNCVGQLFLLGVFLGTDYHLYGLRVARSLIRGEDWRPSNRFPRVTLCDFEVRQLANIHRHTVQCVLPINLFNEKIFVFICFWFIFVAALTALSFLQWALKAMYWDGHTTYVRKQLRGLHKLNRETEPHTKRFTQEYLRQDGIFLTRLIAKNAGDIVAAEVLAGLWDIYVQNNRLVSSPTHERHPLSPIMA